MKILRAKDLKRYRILQGSYDKIINTHTENPVVDHSHTEGFIREVIDREVNQYIGKLENNFKRFIHWKYPDILLPDLLESIAHYLRIDYSGNPYHPSYISKSIKKFSRLTAKIQDEILRSCNLVPAKTKKEKSKQYRNYLLNEDNFFKF